MTRVLISGASIAGPALAYWVLKAGYNVTIVERAPTARPGGQAIDIRGPALDVIAAMGLGERVAALRTRMKGMTVLDRAGNEIERSFERTATGGRFDSGDIEIFRDDLAALQRGATLPAMRQAFLAATRRSKAPRLAPIGYFTRIVEDLLAQPAEAAAAPDERPDVPEDPATAALKAESDAMWARYIGTPKAPMGPARLRAAPGWQATSRMPAFGGPILNSGQQCSGR